MWVDRRKKHLVTFKVDEIELQIIKDMAEAMEIDESEAIRRALWVFRVLYDNTLRAVDALNLPIPENQPLYEALKPIPELANHLGIEIKAWRKQSLEKAKPGESTG
jgi:hypothetical protein